MTIREDALVWLGTQLQRLEDRLVIEAMARRHIGELAAHTRDHLENVGDRCAAAPLCIGAGAINMLNEITDSMPAYPKMLALVMLTQIVQLQDEVARAGMAVIDRDSKLAQADDLLIRTGATVDDLRARLAACEDILGDARPYRTDES